MKLGSSLLKEPKPSNNSRVLRTTSSKCSSDILSSKDFKAVLLNRTFSMASKKLAMIQRILLRSTLLSLRWRTRFLV
uniref:Uncharacterized protein n=1 Tax=Arundo donax TaxID=35708 RepID=A0A0A9E5S2_ARUDO